MADAALKGVSHVIVDEIHERGINEVRQRERVRAREGERERERARRTERDGETEKERERETERERRQASRFTCLIDLNSAPPKAWCTPY